MRQANVTARSMMHLLGRCYVGELTVQACPAQHAAQLDIANDVPAP